MSRTLVPLLFAAAMLSGGLFFARFDLQGLDDFAIVPRDDRAAPRDEYSRGQTTRRYADDADGSRYTGTRTLSPRNPLPREQPSRGAPAAHDGNTLRIASYNIQAFGQHKLEQPQAVEILVHILRQFDLVAIQEVRSKTQDVLPRLIALLNSDGARYDYLLSPRLGRTNSTEQYAFVYDTAALETDREAAYTVNDPDDLMHREPFVAAFRARKAPHDQAFTFTLVNVHTDPDEAQAELNVLDDVYFAVRNDGRGEDDVILLGDFNADDRRLGELGRVPELAGALSHVATNTRGTAMYDNIFVSTRATLEYSGRAGVVDVLREFNLSMQEALDVSDHLPIWAEFSVFEQGQGGSVAQRQGRPAR